MRYKKKQIMMKGSGFFILAILLLFQHKAEGQSHIYDSTVNKQLLDIQAGLDTMLFVKRFEGLETSCVCIDSSDNTIAYEKRNLVNSNYRIRLKQKNVIEPGVECLSRYYARYARFSVTEHDFSTQIIKGDAVFTYGYPASSIIQFLGLTYNSADRENVFFNKLLKATGTFTMYPENDKYRMQLVLKSGPYNARDTIYAYLEIIKEAFRPHPATAYVLYFDQMSIHSGDRNNQIFLKFSSTTFQDESTYYAVLLYNFLRFIDSADNEKKAEAIWLTSFFNNPKCPQCKFIYNQAEAKVKSTRFSLPNTEPVPAH